MNRDQPDLLRRRLMAGAGAAAAAWPLGSALAQTPPAPGAGGPAGRPPAPPPTAEQVAAQLPLKTTGLDHISMWVPDVAEAGKFYGKIFNPALHKEKDPPLRLYVPLALKEPKPPLSYIAIGAANGRPVQFDHYCALVEGYNPAAMAERLKQEGINATGRFGIYTDSDGLQLQMLGMPGGLAASTVPSDRVSDEAPIVEPLGMDSVIIQVSDLEKSLAYYRRFFAGKVTRMGGRAWIDVAGTRLGLEKIADGGKPVISSFCVKTRPFDRAVVSRKIEALGGKIVPATKADGNVLRFSSPMGLIVDLKGA